MNQREVRRIIEQAEGVYTKNWTGMRFDVFLNQIDDKIASCKLAAFNNTLHQIARHILATEWIVINRLQGINYKITPEEDWPPAEKLESIKWTDTKKDLQDSKAKLISLIEKLDDVDLYKPILKDHSSTYVTLHGHIQHSYYHIGQMVVIKNIIEKEIM